MIRTAVFLLIATIFVPHVQAQESSVSTSMDDEKSKRIGSFLDAYVAGKFEASKDIFQEGVRFLWADFSEPHGIDEWNEAVTAHHAAFENIELRNRVVTTSDYDEYGIWTYVWTIWSGTNRATGEDFRLPLHIMYQWEGDQVAREFAYFDLERFRTTVESTLAKINKPTDACPWDWAHGTWRVSSDDFPNAIVHWSKPTEHDVLHGHWIDEHGVYSRELIGWEPDKGQIFARAFGDDGSRGSVTVTTFDGPNTMGGTFEARSPDGTLMSGSFKIVNMDNKKMVATFTTGDGTAMLRTFTPMPKDDPEYDKFHSAMRSAVMKTSGL